MDRPGVIGPVAAQVHPAAAPLERLPLVTLYLTERCNSRCISCDYWRHGRVDMSLAAVLRLLPSLKRLRTETVLVSGGEPLLNPEWPQIAQSLKESGLKLWLLTSGLALAKHARRAADVFDAITVSLDGSNGQTYAAIRGLDAFDKVCEGINAATSAGAWVGVRVTLQRANYREMPLFPELTRRLGARQVSFLAVDVANPHAFARVDDYRADLALGPDDLPELERLLRELTRDHADDFQSRFIAESPHKLQGILQYFRAVLGLGPYPPVHCNAPQFSAVVDAHGRTQPCFFIPGPAQSPLDLPRALNDEPMLALRQSIADGQRPECVTCVCSMWRDLSTLEAANFLEPPSARRQRAMP